MKNALAFSQLVLQKTLLREGAQMTESIRHIQSPQTGEVWTPHYPSKQRPTTDPDLNPKPATKLTERLATETVDGHAPIHGWSVNPGITVAPLGERRLLVAVGPLGAPYFPKL